MQDVKSTLTFRSETVGGRARLFLSCLKNLKFPNDMTIVFTAISWNINRNLSEFDFGYKSERIS